MKILVEVDYADGRKETVNVGPVSQVAFEREHGCGIGVVATAQKISHVYWMAWHASTRGVGSFDEWLETVEGIDENSATDAAPFPEAPSADG